MFLGFAHLVHTHTHAYTHTYPKGVDHLFVFDCFLFSRTGTALVCLANVKPFSKSHPVSVCPA